MPGNIIKINNSKELEWYVGDNRMEELIEFLNKIGFKEEINVSVQLYYPTGKDYRKTLIVNGQSSLCWLTIRDKKRNKKFQITIAFKFEDLEKAYEAVKTKEKCTVCHGKGFTTDHHDPCTECGGSGYYE